MAAQSKIDAVTCRRLARNCVFLLEGNAFPSATPSTGIVAISHLPIVADAMDTTAGIYKSTGTLRISNCKINDATARNRDGGAYCSGSMTIKGSTLFSDNNVYYFHLNVIGTSVIKIIASLTAESPIAKIALSSCGINTKILRKNNDVNDMFESYSQKNIFLKILNGNFYSPWKYMLFASRCFATEFLNQN